MKNFLLFLAAVIFIIAVPVGLITLGVVLSNYNAPDIRLRESTPEGMTTESIAVQYAPLFLQELVPQHPELACDDFICRLDFDGDWNPSNNLENLRKEEHKKKLKASVYYLVLETETHFFITYTVFHPLEWYCTKEKPEEMWYENGMAHVQVVVRKEQPDQVKGVVELIALPKNESVNFYSATKTSFQERNRKFGKEKLLLCDDSLNISENGTHPILVIRSARHTLEMPEACREIFVNFQQLQLRYGINYVFSTNKEGEVPLYSLNPETLVSNQRIPYALLDASEELWKNLEARQFFQKTFHYKDKYGIVEFKEIPLTLKGHDYHSTPRSSMTPFAIGKSIKGNGNLAFNPLVVYRSLFRITSDFSSHYLTYPFLE